MQITLRLNDSDTGEDLSGATIHLLKNGVSEYHADTNESGLAIFDDVEVGDYTVFKVFGDWTFSSNGEPLSLVEASKWVIYNFEASKLNPTTPEDPSLFSVGNLKVRELTGAPVSGYAVHFKLADSSKPVVVGDSFISSYGTVARTNAYGQLAVALPRGAEVIVGLSSIQRKIVVPDQPEFDILGKFSDAPDAYQVYNPDLCMLVSLC